jgi:predicted dehydrogenase
MTKTLGVGIIGASAARGWAKDSHVPAIQGLDGLRLAAVAAGDEKKAQEAKEAFGARAGYASGFDLIKDPAVDIVTVAVKVPDHRELVLAAIAAGKHVYCEWPLGRNLAEAEEMAEAAAAAGVCSAIGLQMRSSVAVLNARKAIDEGRIGRPLTARILSNTAAFGPDVEPAMQFGEDPANGVTLVSIQGAHTFDLAMAVLGGVESLSAMTTTQYPQVKIGGDPTLKARSTSDHVFLLAQHMSGIPVSIEVAGGRPKEAPTSFEVTGTEGTLTIRGGAMRGVQSGRLQWFLNQELQGQ